MDITPNTPQRMTVLIEQNKSETWSVATYLVMADGRRDRRSLGVFETYREAAEALRRSWQNIAL